MSRADLFGDTSQHYDLSAQNCCPSTFDFSQDYNYHRKAVEVIKENVTKQLMLTQNRTVLTFKSENDSKRVKPRED